MYSSRYSGSFLKALFISPFIPAAILTLYFLFLYLVLSVGEAQFGSFLASGDRQVGLASNMVLLGFFLQYFQWYAVYFLFLLVTGYPMLLFWTRRQNENSALDKLGKTRGRRLVFLILLFGAPIALVAIISSSAEGLFWFFVWILPNFVAITLLYRVFYRYLKPREDG